MEEKYAKNLTEITSTKNSDGLSGLDKMEMNLTKLDEGLLTFVEVNADVEIGRILKEHDFSISDEEISYYMEHHKPHHLQVELVMAYWAEHFGSSRNANIITKRNYIYLALILKKMLLLYGGYDNSNMNGENSQSYSALAFMLTGNIKDRVSQTRLIRNNKYINRVNTSYLYEKLKNKKYSYLMSIKSDYFITLLSNLLNNIFTYVSYEHPELLGEEIEYNEDQLSDEILFFLNSI